MAEIVEINKSTGHPSVFVILAHGATQGNTGTAEIRRSKEIAIFQAPIRVVPDQASVFDDTLVDAQAMAGLHSKSIACIAFTNAKKRFAQTRTLCYSSPPVANDVEENADAAFSTATRKVKREENFRAVRGKCL